MKHWYETRWAGLAVRIIGLGMILLAWTMGQMLTQMVRSHSLDQTSLMEILLGMVDFLCASGGLSLTFLGKHLFDKVEISERWRSY